MASNAQALEQQAIEYARRGDFGVTARDANEELTRLVPGNAGAWTRLARCCLELGQLEQATAALDAALQLNPQNTIARNLQAEVERRRQPVPLSKPRPVRRPPAQPATRATRTRSTGSPVLPFDRGVFTTLGHLPAPAALDALAPRLEPLPQQQRVEDPVPAKRVDKVDNSCVDASSREDWAAARTAWRKLPARHRERARDRA